MKYILLDIFPCKNKKNYQNPDQDMLLFHIYDPQVKKTYMIYKPLEYLQLDGGEVPKNENCPMIVEGVVSLRSYRNKEGREVFQPDVQSLKIVKTLDVNKV